MKIYYGKKKKLSPRTLAVSGVMILVALIVLTACFRVLRHVVTRGGDNFFYPYLKMAAGKNSDTDRMRKSAELAGMINTNAVLIEENRKLRQLHDLQKRQPYDFIVAEILLRDPLRYREFFTISKGSKHGIKPGAAVVDVSPGGRLQLVGVVSECSARSAKVITVMDPSLHISGRVGINGMVGFTNTGNISRPRSGRFKIGMLPLRNDYISGGAVVTTGFEKGIPEGIKIGELSFPGSPRSGFGEVDFSCEMISDVRFETLRLVAVVNLAERMK